MSLRSKLIIALLAIELLVTVGSAWGVYQAALTQLRADLIERATLLATTVNDAINATRQADAIRVAVEDITAKSSAVRGITVATKSPFTIWASSLHGADAADPFAAHMLKLLSVAMARGVFGHFFADNGDLVMVQPLWNNAPDDGYEEMPLNRMYAHVDFRPNRAIELPDVLPLEPGSVIDVPESFYHGAVYLRFDWNRVKDRAGNALWRAVLIALAGLLMMVVLSWVLLYRLVLRPVSVMRTAMREQAEGNPESRVTGLGNDEFGQMAQAFNTMLERLAERDQRLRGIVEYLPISLAVHGADGEELLSNQQYRAWRAAGVLPAIGDWLDAERKVRVLAGVVESWDHDRTAADGSVSSLSTVAFPVLPQRGPAREFGTASIDITARKALERALTDAKLQAEAANAAKSRFLSSMSHELRTPLNALIGFTELMQAGADAAERHEYLGHMERAGRHLLTLVNEVLDLAHVESGRLRLSIEDVRLDDILRECGDLSAPIAERYQVRLEVRSCAPELRVRADHTRLKQVLLNLISNGIKYNHVGGTVRVEAVVDGAWVRLDVIDTGRGIPAESRERVFQAFERLDVADGTIEGSGIGLVFSRRIVEMMQGEIDFDSEVGAGSRFWVRLPRATEAGRELEVLDVAVEKGGEANLTQARLLYIEDNPSNRELMTRVIESQTDYELVSFAEPRAGLAAVESYRPDLILLDINLPDMDGFEVLRALRENPRSGTVPVIAVSANAMSHDVLEGLDAGFDAYVAKPFHIDALLTTIAAHLRAQRHAARTAPRA